MKNDIFCFLLVVGIAKNPKSQKSSGQVNTMIERADSYGMTNIWVLKTLIFFKKDKKWVF
jgi:hypothetical protein